MDKIERKLVVVGDSLCGKSYLLAAFIKGVFADFCIPTIQDTYVADIEVDGKRIEFSLCDIGGKDEYDPHRLHAYPDSHVILICFDIGWRISFKNVRERWVPELRRCRSSTPVLLVGCQKDIRRDPKAIEARSRSEEQPVTLEEGIYLAEDIGARNYLECSARTREGVREVFEHAARAAL